MSHIFVQKPNIVPFHLEENGPFPNHPEWPLLLYKEVVKEASSVDPSVVEERFESANWSGCWRDGVFGYHHYHSTAHEALFVYSGEATIQFGGEGGPSMGLQTGDLAVLPAGTAHKKLNGSADFRVIGAYPNGASYDMNYGQPDERPEVDENIEQVPLPDMDPLYGKEGPLFEYWE